MKNYDKLLVLAVVLIGMGMLFALRGEHDPFVFMGGVVTTSLGCLLGLVKSDDKAETIKAAVIPVPEPVTPPQLPAAK